MKKKQKLSSFLVMTLLLVLMGVIIFFVTQQGTGSIFDLRNRASTPGGATTLTLSPPESTTRYVGDVFPIDLMFAANGKRITGIAFRFVFNSSGVISVVDQDNANSGTQIKSFSADLDPSFVMAVNQSSAQPSGSVYIDYATTTSLADGYTNASGQKLATIVFKAVKEGMVTLQHDPQRSIVTEKITTGSSSGTLDVLQTIQDYVVTVVKDTQAPVVTIVGDFGQVPTTATSSSVTFTWTGIDKPDRQVGVTVPLTYSYQFDTQAWSAFSSAVTITKTLPNGTHTFSVRAKDPSGNISTPTSPDSKRTFTLNLTPVLATRTPDNGTTGTNVTLTGYNFGSPRGAALVKFGTKAAAAADYVSWSDTQIVVKVPTGANGDVTVVRGPLASNSLPFSLGTMLKIIFNFEGISQDGGAKTIHISVKRGSTGTPQLFTDVAATWDTTNVAYTATVGPLTAPFTTASNYIVSLKGASRLKKTIKNITLTNNAYNIVKRVAAADTLKIADFNDDNTLTIEDVSLILNKFIVITAPATGNLAPYDLNGDGTFDAVDVGLVLSKYTRLETPGDSD